MCNVCVTVSVSPCVSPAGPGGPAAAASGPVGGGELQGRGAAAAGRLRAALSAELRGKARGPGGGAARRGPTQSCGGREPSGRAAQGGQA